MGQDSCLCPGVAEGTGKEVGRPRQASERTRPHRSAEKSHCKNFAPACWEWRRELVRKRHEGASESEAEGEWGFLLRVCADASLTVSYLTPWLLGEVMCVISISHAKKSKLRGVE